MSYLFGPVGFINEGPPSTPIGNFAFFNPVLWSANLILVFPNNNTEPGPPP